MDLITFKQKYFTYSFYWVDGSNFEKLQQIAITMGLTWHNGCKSVSKWSGQKNLVMFPSETFQSIPFWCPDHAYGIPIDFDEMMSDHRIVIENMLVNDFGWDL